MINSRQKKEFGLTVLDLFDIDDDDGDDTADNQQHSD